jgi:hypothetical protein
MRALIASLVLMGPSAATAASHILAIDDGRARSADMECPPAETGYCSLRDDAYRISYELRLDSRLGFRASHLYLNDLRLTTDTDPIFNLPSISSSMNDVSVTYSHPAWKRVAVGGRLGLGYWEEHRSREGVLSRATSDGVAPVLGIHVDFGSGRVRAGLSADTYLSVGDAGHVHYYDVGVRIVFGDLKPSR